MGGDTLLHTQAVPPQARPDTPAAGNLSLPDIDTEVLERITDGFIALDSDWRITYFNGEAERLNNMRREDILGKNHWELFPATVGATVYCELHRAFTERVPVDFENYYAPWKRWFHVKAYPASDGGLAVFYEDITDRKAVQEALRRSEERFRGVFESSAVGVAILTLDGQIIQTNSAFCAILGYFAEELRKFGWITLVDADNRTEWEAQIEQLVSGKLSTFVLEQRCRRKDNQFIWVSASVSAMRDAAGQPEYIICLCQDIEARKQAERAALLLAAIVDSSDDAIVSKNLNGIITSWNKAAERLFGYTAAEAVGQSVTMIIPPDRQDEEPRILARLRRGERVDHFETIRRCKDGTLLDISLTISPVKDANGRIIGASKIARNITERKRIEKALLASETNFRQLADSMPQIVWTALPDGHLDYYNERWYQFTGFKRDNFGDASWQSILHPDDVGPTTQAWYASVRTGEPFRIELRFWDRAENRWRWFIGRALPAHDATGQIVKWFGTSTDIDDQKRTEHDLRQANADLEQFAYSASHDLQEPLRGIRIYSELLTSRYSAKLDGQALEFLQYLGQNALRMEMLVHDLLTYTQIGKLESPYGDADANQALADTLANLKASIDETGAQITCSWLPVIRMHDAHIRQLFQNLIGNAIKYRSPERTPAVHVDAKRNGSSWVFSVADNGIGIEPQYKERIFGLFKRLHSEDQYPGTGIGLALCQRIIERYNGRIWVESQYGQGSKFMFTVPL